MYLSSIPRRGFNIQFNQNQPTNSCLTNYNVFPASFHPHRTSHLIPTLLAPVLSSGHTLILPVLSNTSAEADGCLVRAAKKKKKKKAIYTPTKCNCGISFQLSGELLRGDSSQPPHGVCRNWEMSCAITPSNTCVRDTSPYSGRIPTTE